MTTMAVTVQLHATDPILRAGVVSQLRPRPEVRLVAEPGPHEADVVDVVVVVADTIDEPTAALLRRQDRNAPGPRTVLVASGLDATDLMQALDAGVRGVLRRHEATAGRLVAAIISAARDERVVPPDLVAALLDEVEATRREARDPQQPSRSRLSERETTVLRLIADGCNTHEIARRLAYSERTVKNVLHDVTTRLNLRNRSHAVAYALREGLI